MIKSAITHPPLLAALAQCGHKTQVLIADGNYACMTHAPKDATVVYLNLAPGTLAAPPILEKLLACINVESAALMACPPDFTNTIEAEYRQLLPAQCPVEHLPREAFYAAVKSDQTLLVIASGEQRRFANLLLTVAPGGVRIDRDSSELPRRAGAAHRLFDALASAAAISGEPILAD